MVAKKFGYSYFTTDQFAAVTGICRRTIRNRFVNWKTALAKAGIENPEYGNTGRGRYSDEECFENLFNVWLYHGRAPHRDEMSKSPSTIGVAAYYLRWGTWRKALLAFVERANSDVSAITVRAEVVQPGASTEIAVIEMERRPKEEDSRNIRLGLRFRVLQRDSFRCCSCGRSPAISPGVELHIDHVIPFSRGGKTALDNLQTLCKECNLGKSNTQF